MSGIERKSLLYLSKVEYGGWTINHVLGCSHGCRYPCYAFMLARRTGRVATLDEWCTPRVVRNARELLRDELRRHGDHIERVHLSFTTDPFMFDTASDSPRREVVDLTTDLVKMLNDHDIPVTTLTKGVYPEDFVALATTLHPENQYGASIVSTSDEFRSKWEPGAAKPSDRLASLKRLSESGHLTWMSIEPFPTPNIDPGSTSIDSLLQSATFVDKVVFGRWNYNASVTKYPEREEHYERAARRVLEWCRESGKACHIKRGTPLATESTRDILDRRASDR